jgi:pilus assembly protein CpaB
VTLEVDVTSAQKIALAASVGTLSLMLRKAGEIASTDTRRVTLSDLSNSSAPSGDSRFATIRVTRPSAKQEYSVPVEGRPSRAVASSSPEASHN